MGDSLVFLHVVFGHGVARCFELGKISEISAKNGTFIITRHDVHVYVYAYVYTEYMNTYTYTYVRSKLFGIRISAIGRISEISPKNGTFTSDSAKSTQSRGFRRNFDCNFLWVFYALFPKFGRPFFCVFFQGFRRAKKKSDEVDSKDIVFHTFFTLFTQNFSALRV